MVRWNPYQAVEKRDLCRWASSFVIAAYFKVRLIPQDSPALHRIVLDRPVRNTVYERAVITSYTPVSEESTPFHRTLRTSKIFMGVHQTGRQNRWSILQKTDCTRAQIPLASKPSGLSSQDATGADSNPGTIQVERKHAPFNPGVP